MRFIKRVIPPNEERRRYLLKKLNEFKGAPASETFSIRTKLREELSKCEGYTSYFVQHRGLEVYMGDEFTRKKHFLMFKDEKTFQPFIQKMREEKRKPVTQSKFKSLSETGENWVYNLKGGVFDRPGMIVAKDRGMRRLLVEKTKKPMTADSYVGIELEYASTMSVALLREMVADMRLHRHIRVVNDRSIIPSLYYPHQVEICVLSKFADLSDTFTKLGQLITGDVFQSNPSCGLHVHLDARHGDVRRMYANLVTMQPLLFQLADISRRNNGYCRSVISPDITAPFDEDHYAAISKLSYTKHRSVEVRIHHGTLDLNVVERWVRLLKAIADYEGHLDTAFPPLTLLKSYIKPSEDLLKYVEERVAI